MRSSQGGHDDIVSRRVLETIAGAGRPATVLLGFRQMATAWRRLACSEEFTSPVDEQIDPLGAEKICYFSRRPVFFFCEIHHVANGAPTT
jgi:hypothetical protein